MSTTGGAPGAGAAGTGLRLDGLSQLCERLVEVAAVGRSEDVHSLGEEGHRRRGRPAFEHLVCNRLGLPEQVVGDRQPEDQLVRFLRVPWRLPRRKLAQLLETLFFQLQKLAVVFVVDLLERWRAPGRASRPWALPVPPHPGQRHSPGAETACSSTTPSATVAAHTRPTAVIRLKFILGGTPACLSVSVQSPLLRTRSGYTNRHAAASAKGVGWNALSCKARIHAPGSLRKGHRQST